MKKILLILTLLLATLTGCNTKEAHWSYEACIQEIVAQNEMLNYEYTVEEIEHNEIATGDDEIHCFDITIIQDEKETRWCCFSVISGNEVLYVDCDLWGE